jgi:hypothetical protein
MSIDTDSLDRLLPGDLAPHLGLSKVLNRSTISEFLFDRLTIVTLWNAGCASSLPLLNDISEFVAAHSVRSYAIAVMVRDLDATATSAEAITGNIIIGVEEPSKQPSILSRGLVTRNWLETSGQRAIPSSFIVNECGIVVWMGDPNYIRRVLPEIINENWDLGAERARWASLVTDEDVSKLRLERNVMDLLAAGDIEGARQSIELSERKAPNLSTDKDVNFQKFLVLTSAPNDIPAIISQYKYCLELFKNDLEQQLLLSDLAIRRTTDRSTIKEVRDHLASFDIENTVNEFQIILSLRIYILIALAQQKLNHVSEAKEMALKAETLIQNGRLPSHIVDWARIEMGTIKEALPTD